MFVDNQKQTPTGWCFCIKTKLGVYSPIVVSFEFTNLQLPIVRPPKTTRNRGRQFGRPVRSVFGRELLLGRLPLGGSCEDAIESSDEMILGGSRYFPEPILFWGCHWDHLLGRGLDSQGGGRYWGRAAVPPPEKKRKTSVKDLVAFFVGKSFMSLFTNHVGIYTVGEEWWPQSWPFFHCKNFPIHEVSGHLWDWSAFAARE